METDALWRRVIKAKCENIWGDWCTKKVTSAYGFSLWRFIRSDWLNSMTTTLGPWEVMAPLIFFF